MNLECFKYLLKLHFFGVYNTYITKNCNTLDELIHNENENFQILIINIFINLLVYFEFGKLNSLTKCIF